MSIQELKEKYPWVGEKHPWMVGDEERAAMWERFEKAKGEFRARRVNSVRKFAFDALRKNGGFMDKKLLNNEICKHVLETYFAEHNDDVWVEERGGSVSSEASWFASEVAGEVVRWLADNTCIDLYDVVATKQGMERLQKFGMRVDAVKNGKDDTVKVWPKQWNIG